MTDELFDSLPSGWLSRAEAELLHSTAKDTLGNILEVGCYKGRSTALLASLGRQVVCVDPFSGFDSDDPDGDRVYAEWHANMLERRIAVASLLPPPAVVHAFLDAVGYISLYRQRIEEWLPCPMGFVYLDGDHTYEGTKAQIHKAMMCTPWSLAIHDVNDSGGGAEVKRAALELLGPWTARAERLAVWTDLPLDQATLITGPVPAVRWK